MGDACVLSKTTVELQGGWKENKNSATFQSPWCLGYLKADLQVSIVINSL